MPRKSKLLPRVVVGILLLGALAVAPGYWWVRWHRAPHRDVREVLGWLPEDTETVICTEGPLRLENKERSNGAPSLAEALEGTAMLLPSMFRQGELFKTLQGRRVVLSVEGSRKFTSPNGLGLMPFQGAGILILEEGLGWTGFSLERSLAEKASEVRTIAGTRVASFSEKAEGDTWELSIAIPRANVLIVASHRGYLEEVLGRLQGGSAARPLHDFFEEGLRRLRGARFWAVRRYDAASAATDPTSPLIPKAPANEPDPQARGLHFVYDPGRSPIAKLTYFSTNPEALSIAERFWRHPNEGLRPDLKSTAPGEVEISVVPDRAAFLHFVLLAALGHAIYL